MNVNPKKSLVLKNRTNYFIPDKDRIKVRVSSPLTYQSRQSKIEGYETRLYWQYRYCLDRKGQTFYYTLTYNDKSIPHHYGMNCFDYEDLRDLLTGGFRKQLLRKYGTTFKYFVGAELGDGKGERGLHNNPHYHILFFLEPVKDCCFPYVQISPEQFRHLVRFYWQGFDQDDCFVSYRDARYGIAKEGDNCGLVTDFRACMYCAKYVCKDVALQQNESEVIKQLTNKLRAEYRYKEETYQGFWFDYKSKKPYKNTDDVRIFRRYIPDIVSNYQNRVGHELISMIGEYYQPFVVGYCNKFGLWHRFYEYLDSVLEVKIKEGVNEWRNRYCNKCRISQGVGKSALDTIVDKYNPLIRVPSKDGFKDRPIGMYYYRQLFCNVVKDSVSGCNLYLLNEDGIKYKLNKLQERIDKKVSQSYDYLKLLAGSPLLFDKMRSSDVNTVVTMNHKRFNQLGSYLIDKYGYDDILKRYAEFKLVYEDRFFSYQIPRSGDDSIFPSIDVRKDYERFLTPSFYSVPRNDIGVESFLEDIPKNYLPYSQHKYFLPFIGLFGVLDLCTDYFFVQGDNKKQADAEERANVKRFHDKIKLKAFYSSFK